MAGTGKPSMVAAAAFVIACGLAALAPTAAMAQIPFMIPNFNFGPQHYRGSSHYSTRSHSRHEEDKAPDKTAPAPDKSKERDATEPTQNTSAPRQQQTSSAPRSRDAAPSGGSDAGASPPPAPPAKKPSDDQPTFQPSR
jgi:hypothetical protein